MSADLDQEQKIVDFLAERALRNPNVQHIVADAQMFDELKTSPAWRRLYQKIVEDKKKFLSDITRRLMTGGKVTDEEIAYERGFYAGALWIVSHPEHAEQALERAARHAWALATVMGDDEQEDSQ